MNPEKPKQYTPEEIAEMEKSRTISDAELLKGGAEYIVSEEGEKVLHATEEQINQVESLGDPYFRALLKHIDAQTIEDIILVAERTNSRSETKKALRSKWLPLIDRLKNDLEVQKQDKYDGRSIEAVACCLSCALRILSHYDKSTFGELYSRACAAGEKLRGKVPSKGWSWAGE